MAGIIESLFEMLLIFKWICIYLFIHIYWNSNKFRTTGAIRIPFVMHMNQLEYHDER